MQKQRRPRYDSFHVGLVSYRVWTRGSFRACGGWWISHVTLWVSNWTKPLSVTKYLKKKKARLMAVKNRRRIKSKGLQKFSLTVKKWETKTNTQRKSIFKELRACHLMFSVFPLSSLRVKHVLKRTNTNKMSKKYLKYTRGKSPTFSGIFVCGPLQSFVVNVCTVCH